MSETFSIGEVAERTGMTVHALRYYEKNGLLAAEVPRTKSGHRRYSLGDIEWIEICRQLRHSDMPLATLREYTDLVRAGAGNEQQRLDLLRRHQGRVQAHVESLLASLELIKYKVDFTNSESPTAPPRRSGRTGKARRRGADPKGCHRRAARCSSPWGTATSLAADQGSAPCAVHCAGGPSSTA